MEEKTISQKRRVKVLSPEVARKIAAGEVIDRPNAIVRELMDNAVDSGADRIRVEITGGGIEKIRVIDNGRGMDKEDLQNCARPHATSKIASETDLLNLHTLGFRGEALSSMAAVSRLTVTSGGWKMRASVTEDHIMEPTAEYRGTIVQTEGLFENFPARRRFLKRPASEGTLCRSTFEEKTLPRPDIAFSLCMDGEEKLSLPAGQTLKQRFVQAMEFFESEDLFYDVKGSDTNSEWNFDLIIGEPSVTRSNRKNIYIYINGRRVTEYSLVQAIEYGTQGCFPNGTHPVACLFVNIDPSLVDFNIHPAKREVRFKDISSLHHGVSSITKDFFKKYTLSLMDEKSQNNTALEFMDTSFAMTQTEEPAYEEHRDTSFIKQYMPPRRSDTRSRFFSEASVEGRITKPNYIQSLAKTAADLPQNAGTDSETFAQTQPEQNAQNKNDGFHFVGITLGTFIIAEKDDILYIIDQHAAHERIIYNQIMADAGQKQELIVPYTVYTDGKADDNYLEALLPKLNEAGFTGKNCGDGKWEFSSVPLRWKGKEADLARDLLDRRINPGDMINAAAASTACRAAVMDGTVLDEKTAEEIARKALELPDPHCPHGRPVYTAITRRQLFSLVKRI